MADLKVFGGLGSKGAEAGVISEGEKLATYLKGASNGTTSSAVGGVSYSPLEVKIGGKNVKIGGFAEAGLDTAGGAVGVTGNLGGQLATEFDNGLGAMVKGGVNGVSAVITKGFGK